MNFNDHRAEIILILLTLPFLFFMIYVTFFLF